MSLLGYLNDHLAGAAAGIQLAERCRDRDPDSELGHVLQTRASSRSDMTGTCSNA